MDPVHRQRSKSVSLADLFKFNMELISIQFIVKSYTVQNLAFVLQLVESIFQHDQISTSRYPTKIVKLTTLKSPHVHKKSREQFETRTHKMEIEISRVNRMQVDTFIQYVQSFKLLGVQLQVRIIDSTELFASKTSLM